MDLYCIDVTSLLLVVIHIVIFIFCFLSVTQVTLFPTIQNTVQWRSEGASLSFSFFSSLFALVVTVVAFLSASFLSNSSCFTDSWAAFCMAAAYTYAAGNSFTSGTMLSLLRYMMPH